MDIIIDDKHIANLILHIAHFSHCHIVPKYDVGKNISNLKSEKIDDQGTFLKIISCMVQICYIVIYLYYLHQ